MKIIKYLGKKTLESLIICLSCERTPPEIEFDKTVPFAQSIESVILLNLELVCFKDDFFKNFKFYKI